MLNTNMAWANQGSPVPGLTCLSPQACARRPQGGKVTVDKPWRFPLACSPKTILAFSFCCVPSQFSTTSPPPSLSFLPFPTSLRPPKAFRRAYPFFLFFCFPLFDLFVSFILISISFIPVAAFLSSETTDPTRSVTV